MKNGLFLAFAIVIISILVSCRARGDEEEGQGRTVIPASRISTGGGRDEVREAREARFEADPIPVIPSPVGFRPIMILDLNLDRDQNEEQIVVSQSLADEPAPLSVRIADFDPVSDRYYLAWETELSAWSSTVTDRAFSGSSSEFIPIEQTCVAFSSATRKRSKKTSQKTSSPI